MYILWLCIYEPWWYFYNIWLYQILLIPSEGKKCDERERDNNMHNAIRCLSETFQLDLPEKWGCHHLDNVSRGWCHVTVYSLLRHGIMTVFILSRGPANLSSFQFDCDPNSLPNVKPSQSKCLCSHAVFGKNWPNSRSPFGLVTSHLV